MRSAWRRVSSFRALLRRRSSSKLRGLMRSIRVVFFCGAGLISEGKTNRDSGRMPFGTDLGFDQSMYRLIFRFLETEDEHFYQMDEFNHHYPLHCFALP